jgi:hypothetical protein
MLDFKVKKMEIELHYKYLSMALDPSKKKHN